METRRKKAGDFCPELSLSGCWRCCCGGGSPWKRWKQKLCSICFTWKATITKRNETKTEQKLGEKLCNFPAERPSPSLAVCQSFRQSFIRGIKWFTVSRTTRVKAKAAKNLKLFMARLGNGEKRDLKGKCQRIVAPNWRGNLTGHY